MVRARARPPLGIAGHDRRERHARGGRDQGTVEDGAGEAVADQRDPDRIVRMLSHAAPSPDEPSCARAYGLTTTRSIRGSGLGSSRISGTSSSATVRDGSRSSGTDPDTGEVARAAVVVDGRARAPHQPQVAVVHDVRVDGRAARGAGERVDPPPDVDVLDRPRERLDARCGHERRDGRGSERRGDVVARVRAPRPRRARPRVVVGPRTVARPPPARRPPGAPTSR